MNKAPIEAKYTCTEMDKLKFCQALVYPEKYHKQILVLMAHGAPEVSHHGKALLTYALRKPVKFLMYLKDIIMQFLLIIEKQKGIW